MHDLDLVLPGKRDPERDRVATAWLAAGGNVVRLERFWEPPPELLQRRRQVRIYGNDSFALVLAQQLGLRLVSPADELLGHLDRPLLQRELAIRRLGEADGYGYPCFVKPLVPKQFRAAVQGSQATLAQETSGLPADTLVYVAEVVQFRSEARAWVLDGTMQDVALYEGEDALAGARTLLANAAAQIPLPSTCVLDAGFIPGRGWALVEANAAWGAGLNGCAPERVLGCIERATAAVS